MMEYLNGNLTAEEVRKSDLYKRGDCINIWVNQGEFELLQMQHEAMRQQLAEQTSAEQIFDLGFSISSESYNGEYGCDQKDDYYKKLRSEALAAYQVAQPTPSVEALLEALRQIADMTYDHWSNGAKAGQIATVALSSYKPTEE